MRRMSIVSCYCSINFLTNTYLSTLRAYTCGREGRKGKQEGEIPLILLKGILEIKWPDTLAFQMGKLGLKEALICSKSYSQVGTKLEPDHGL